MALAILALTGCGSGGSDSTKNGPSLDTARVEEVIESNSDVIPDASVKCPRDIGLKRGLHFRCDVTGSGDVSGKVVVVEEDASGKKFAYRGRAGDYALTGKGCKVAEPSEFQSSCESAVARVT